VSVNPGIDSIWKDEIERRRQQGVDTASQITIPDTQERAQAILRHSAEEKYHETLWNKIDSNFVHEVCLNSLKTRYDHITFIVCSIDFY